ncbi:isoprenylcysteine carboxylmethyltransferase family protein [Nocardia sp. XZ_19_385]|uniref:methyltransferase family protein n=1 Tax=Nocardia sp. XZ_19_385 TaxID=2769488 RepID=UPI0018909379|nr:isoprenylcysteine carboxylmethyltransferase family protein [Nocardia sp. XZ_19_385]
MAALTLILIGLWLAVVVGLRAVVHFRRTEGADIRFRDRPGSTQWWAKAVSSAGFLAIVAAAIAGLLGLPPLPILDRIQIAVAGVGLTILGTALSVIAQFAMGTSWRADVDPDARTPLITSGPFRWVRNPVLTGVMTTFAGLTLTTPNPIALAALACTVAGIQIQVRGVEEPYLRQTLGRDYIDYAARTGRFVPWLGRLR